jgi:transposase InsO family protein
MYFATHKLEHGDLVLIADLVDRSVRTLWNWRREGERGSPGHPPHSAEAKAWALEECRRVWALLPRGHDGEGSVLAALSREGVEVPLRLVRESVKALKAERRARVEQRHQENRVHVTVLAKNAVWALDQTHLGRDEQVEQTGLVVREALDQLVLGLSAGPRAAGPDVVRLLERTAGERGVWPFVVQMDNGSENKNHEVREVLTRHQVIALWNEPHTPQHNARVERTIGDLKRAGGFHTRAARGAGATQGPVCSPEVGVLETDRSLCVRLFAAWRTLNEETPRPQLGGLTPAELDRIAEQAEDRACRARFYTHVCSELERIARAPESARALRKLQREVIWSALQEFGLVTRTRGGMPVPTVKAEGIS